MLVRWTAPAAQDLYDITRYIQRDNPTAALEVAKAIYDGCESLTNNSNRGRKGRIAGSRELVFPKLPYIAVYSVTDDAVEILHVYHGARDWR